MTDDTTLVLHRILKAPRALVWACWTDPDHIKQFFVPRPHEVTEAIIEPRAGGRFFTMMRVDGTDYPNDGAVLEAVEGERLVFTDMMVADWQPVENPGLGFTATLLLKDHPEGTDYTAIARHRTRESAETHEKMGFSQGWGTVAQQLEDYIRGSLM
ncbi:MAG: polyketide cyclase [Limimaricola sp.]|uniref:SRPBCC family protein n=1 Tax=Limimaricola sp. TaxID=2211665 RepID=UPI001D3C0CC0|nr:SRPBCC family protein [Limimaricola sp.]MBI1418542.1 polyketide cyclase [Limimaricola sp.]